jgi:hypothetical protein
MPSQAHGKRFEDFVKACGRFTGSADQGRSPTSDFDIEAKFDREFGLPTSVKSTGSSVVTLSDARRFFGIDEPFRMIVGRYWQVDNTKEFREVHEFVLTPDVLARLRGDITLDQVANFHRGLSLANFPEGAHAAARVWAQEQRQIFSGFLSQIVLNPKIDSDKQRRLQCSVSLSSLKDAVGAGGYSLHTEWLGETRLPIIQRSERRTFNR